MIGEENVLLIHVLGGNILAQELKDFSMLLGEHDNKSPTLNLEWSNGTVRGTMRQKLVTSYLTGGMTVSLSLIQMLPSRS